MHTNLLEPGINIGEANVRPLPVFQASPRVAQSEICPGEASGTTESFNTNTQFSRKESDQEHCSTCTVVALQVAGHVDRQSWTPKHTERPSRHTEGCGPRHDVTDLMPPVIAGLADTIYMLRRDPPMCIHVCETDPPMCIHL